MNTVRAWKGELVATTIDLASVSVREPQRGQGHCSRFIDQLETWAESVGRRVYVENVLSPELRYHLSRRGYAVDDPDSALPCYLQMPSRK